MNDVNAGLTVVLKGDAELATLGLQGVYKDVAPQGTPTVPTPTPYAVFGHQGGPFSGAHDGSGYGVPGYYLKFIEQSTSSVKVGLMDKRATKLLHGLRIPLPDGRSALCRRSGSMPDASEVVDGKTYKSVGGMYRIGPV